MTWTIWYESYLAEEAPEAADGEGAEGEGAEAVEGEEGLPEGYPVDEEAAAEGMKVEVRISPSTTNSLTPNVSPLYFVEPLYFFYQKRKKLFQAEATEEPTEEAAEE